MKKIILFTMILGSFWLSNGKALAATLNVPSEYASIQAAIEAASSGDTVEVAAGTYTENIMMKSEVVINGAGPDVTIIDGDGKGSVVIAESVVSFDSPAKLEGFTITNGVADYGGGMAIWSSSVTVANCIFTTNSATYGGGMSISGSSPTVSGCTFLNNTATGDGGGMYNISGSFPTVINCTFSGNSAPSGYGGGMCNNSSSPIVTNCTFSNNTSKSAGGGMRNSSSSPTVTGCTFTENSSIDSYGGGIGSFYSSPTVSNCLFSSNSSGTSGGGVGNYQASTTITNCIFYNNEANQGGGLGNLWISSPTVVNCTFYGNTANSEGGSISNDARCSTVITNCILWGDSVNEIYDYDGDAYTPTVNYSDIHGGYGVAEDKNIDKDPRFVNADGCNFHLNNGSPCIDVGTSEGITLPVTDFEGDPRIIGSAPDMGADESLYKKLVIPYIPLLLED